MRLAVVQHLFRTAPGQDLDALAESLSRAVTAGADVVLMPDLLALRTGPFADEYTARLAAAAAGRRVIAVNADSSASETGSLIEDSPLGTTVLLSDDSCVDAEVHAELARRNPDALVLAPGSESELQAEAILELAVGLSTSVAPLVVIVEPDGAAIGDAGHGGSAIVQLGDIRVEAVAGDDLLMTDIEIIEGPPNPRDVLPEVPLVLAQRLHAHRVLPSCAYRGQKYNARSSDAPW